LVTLTGPGGVGKTRLAIAIADSVAGDFDEVWIVLPAGVRDPALVLPTVAWTLGSQQTGAQKPEDMLRRYLGTCSAVLLLDNCEHVLEAAAELAKLLSDCPRLRLLATSRERLRMQGERIYAVPPLELPPSSGGSAPTLLRQAPAVRLFMDRAVVTDPGFVLNEHNAATIAELCRQLDGLPLAIELASAQVAAMPPDVMLTRIHRRLDLLVGFRDQPYRHRTLRATLEWSHDLLTANEQKLFRRLAVFAGGWTLDAAEAVCSGADLDSTEIVSILARLVERSLVICESVGQGHRYRLLETVREYARGQLSAAGEEKHIRGRHRAWCLELAAFTAPRSFRGLPARI